MPKDSKPNPLVFLLIIGLVVPVIYVIVKAVKEPIEDASGGSRMADWTDGQWVAFAFLIVIVAGILVFFFRNARQIKERDEYLQNVIAQKNREITELRGRKSDQ
jgi:hypothetical protein